MKRIIAILLALTCILSFAACNNDNNDNNDGSNKQTATVETFTAAIANTNPTLSIITSVVNTSLGDLNARYEIAYNADGSATITYSYEKFNTLEEGASEELKSTYNGTVTRAADGTYTSDDELPDLSSVTAGVALDLTKLDASKVTINDKGDVLTATVSKAASEAVFGTAFSVDLTLKISISEGKVELVNIDYEGGKIVCQYN